MSLTFKQFLSEAKYFDQTPEKLAEHLVELVNDVFEFVYPDDYDTQEEYTDALIEKTIEKFKEVLPGKLEKTFTQAIWSVYHDIDASRFYDTESYVDALFNDLVKEIRWYAGRADT